jgi:hypothetical protein
MSQRRKHLEKQLAEAERELEAAKKLSEVRAAATKRRLALEGLRWLDAQETKSKRSPSRRARGGQGASS